jgi:hypothetical protein
MSEIWAEFPDCNSTYEEKSVTLLKLNMLQYNVNVFQPWGIDLL